MRVSLGAAEETLDFLGTGGALGDTGTVPRVLALRGTVLVFRVPRVQALFSPAESSASPLVTESGWAEEKGSSRIRVGDFGSFA